MTDVFKGTSALGGNQVWIFADKIVAITSNTFGGAIVHMADGHQYALREKVEDVIATMEKPR